MSVDATAKELLQLNQRLLDAIAGGDWATYEALCAADLTCFEPESGGQLVHGLAFHKFYFGPGRLPGKAATTIVSPHVRLLGDTAIVCYVRINQCIGADGESWSQTFSETRIWEKNSNQWRHVHFHRSPTNS